jgi:hypothetical protein
MDKTQIATLSKWIIDVYFTPSVFKEIITHVKKENLFEKR